MRRSSWICVVAALGFLFQTPREFEYKLVIDDSPSEIEGLEDLQGRMEYFQLMLSDPNTGEIPSNIRTAEIAFARNHELNSNRARNGNLEFSTTGPFNVGGRTRAVAFDIRDEKVILAGGVSGGVWKSTDGGLTWTRKSDPLNRNSVTCLAQDTRPGREDTWYHGTGEIVGNSARGGNAPFRGNGIYKSEDNGESWFPITSTQDSDPTIFNSQFQYIWNIEINPENLVEDELLIAAYGGILRSLDGGETWSVSIGQKLFDLPDTVDLNDIDASFYTALGRSNDNVFYATLSTDAGGPRQATSPDAGIYYSLDGEEWENISPLTPESEYRRVVMGSSPSIPEITYFMIDSNPILILEHDLALINSPSRINGFDPEPREIPEFDENLGILNTQGSYNMTINVHPEDPDLVFVGGTNLFRSTEGFRTEESIDWIGGYNPEGGVSLYPDHHPDQHDLLFLPSDPDIVLSANDGGLYLSPDITADSVFWSDRNNGYVTSQFFTIAQAKEASSSVVLGGMQDNGTYLSTGNTNWKSIIGGDGAYAATTDDEKLWFVSFQRGQTLRVTLDDDFDIASFGRVDPGSLVSASGSQFLFVNPFILDPKNENRMFCAGGNNMYFHPNVSQIPGGSQTPTGLGWKKLLTEPLGQGVFSALDIAADGKRLYLGSSNSDLYRLDNAEDESKFELKNISSEGFPVNSYVSSIAVNPADNDHLVVTFSNYNVRSIFESTDGGSTFIDISGDLEENPDGSGAGPSTRWVKIVPTTSETLIFVGTSTGLYSSVSTGSETAWIKESSELIGNAVITMMDYRSSDGRLVVASHGNGVFETTIPSFLPIERDREVSTGFELGAVYPNPFSLSTKIQFTIPEPDDVRVDILTADGSLVNTILWGPQFAGKNEVVWNGDTPSGTSLANGVYFYRISYRDESLSGRILLRR